MSTPGGIVGALGCACSPSTALVGDPHREKYYPDLPGGVLDSIGRLFKRFVKMYVPPVVVDIFKAKKLFGWAEASGPACPLQSQSARDAG